MELAICFGIRKREPFEHRTVLQYGWHTSLQYLLRFSWLYGIMFGNVVSDPFSALPEDVIQTQYYCTYSMMCTVGKQTQIAF